MAKLVREIVKEDIPEIKGLLLKVFGSGDYKDIKRLGGMTNRSYKITKLDGTEYLARIPGEGTEALINRMDERKSTELACKLGIDSDLLYFGDDGKKVMKFIETSQPISSDLLKIRDNIKQAADIFRKLHTCGEDTGVRFEVFEMAAMYEHLIDIGGVKLYSDYLDIKRTVMTIKAEVDANCIANRVPCHNDSLVDNWVLSSKGKLYLIDWEYSGMNELMWDLSCLSIEAEYGEVEDNILLEYYLQHEPTIDEKKKFLAAKLYVDYLWALWGLTRVPYDGEFMQEYADGRYLRLKRNIEAYNKLI